MSQGSAAVVPVAIVLAAGSAVVLAAAGAAVLVAYAANQAAEGTLRAVGRAGAALEAEAAAQCDADRQALRWQAVAADVVALNGRLRMAAAQARTLGVAVDLPRPLDLEGRRREEAQGWAVATERRLAAAQQVLDGAAVDAHRHRLLAGLPVASVTGPDTAQVLQVYKATLRSTRAVHEPPRAPDVGNEVTAILARVDPDATPIEHERVLRTALLARAQRDAHDADAYLLALRRLVDITIAGDAARRRQAAHWLQALEAAAAVSPGPAPSDGTAARLLAVVEGTAELTDELRDEGRRAAEAAATITREAFLVDRVRSLLVSAGYAVDAGVETARGARLTATRAHWGGEHEARLFVARDGGVTGRLARSRPGAGDDARARDAARCADLNARLLELASPTSGVTVSVEAGRPPLLAYTEDVENVPMAKPKPKQRTHE